jgi:hypothetical protein
VRLAVYDATGRLVARLVDEVREPGHYEAIWNGRDAAGRTCAAGVYLCRLDTGHVRDVKRVTMVK